VFPWFETLGSKDVLSPTPEGGTPCNDVLRNTCRSVAAASAIGAPNRAAASGVAVRTVDGPVEACVTGAFGVPGDS